MALEIEVLSERKGSNPGGLCRINYERGNFEGYFKYCFGAKIPHKLSSFTSDHQPIYEAITFELSRKMGLHVPQFFVAINSKKNIRFVNKSTNDRDHSGRPYYFVSKIIHESRDKGKEELGDKIISSERVYLEGLHISDILGKRQNYVISPSNSGKVFYIDLGCSFVHAKGGFISLPNSILKLKKMNHKREGYHLNNKNIIAPDDETIINLGELANSFSGMTLPSLNPLGRVGINDILSAEEILEIKEYITHNFCENLSHFKSKGLLI